MKHKLKRIFNSRMLSRALITVITCSIIFSYAVLCPQAEGSYQFVSLGPYSVEFGELAYDFLGKDIIPLLDFAPETYLYYGPRAEQYAFSDSNMTFVLNGMWTFSSFEPLTSISPGTYNFSFDCKFFGDNQIYHCTSIKYQVSDNNSVLYFIDDSGISHEVYINGFYRGVYVFFDNTFVNLEFAYFILDNLYCIDLPASYDSLTFYPISLSLFDYSTDFISISLSLAVPYNDQTDNIYDFIPDNVYIYDDFLNYNSFYSVPHTFIVTSEYVATDVYTGVDYLYVSYNYVLDLSSFSDVENILAFVPLSTFDPFIVGYSEAAAFISPLTIESFSSVDQAFLNSINNVTNKLEETNATLNNIQNTLTNVTPEMQQSLDSLETLMQDEAGKVEDVINGMDQIGTDFGTEIGDFDNILNENAGTLEDIGSTTYNSFINDVFGNWFFVSMFALFGAFAFFSRAVFG